MKGVHSSQASLTADAVEGTAAFDPAAVRARLSAEHAAKAKAERQRAIALKPIEPVVLQTDLASFAKAEKRAAKGEIPESNDDKRAVEQGIQRRAEEQAVALGIAESVRLAKERGETIETATSTRDRTKPAQRVPKADGLSFLVGSKDAEGNPRITPQQYAAGRMFERFYRATHRSDTGSCLNFLEIRGGSGYSQAQIIAYARCKLDDAYREVHQHNGMWFALKAVCGEGRRPTEVYANRRAYERLESQLDCALTILVKLWGM